ncbi:MAG: hypothetical protein O2V44_07955 [Candidatus Bathyarchaeota archaeon]|nr:hypothetical protein [Candidatus Bathyarchaeota archaeon]
MSRKRKKEREISVSAPDYIPKRAPIFKDTTGTEALDVFTVAENVGRVLSFVMIAVGIFVIVLSVYSILTSVNMFLNPLFISVLGFVGALNLLCGLLLLSKK